MQVGVSLFGIVLAAWVVGCNTPIQVAFDEGVDFSGYRSWDWLPGASGRIDLLEGDREALHEEVSALIEQQLARQGFSRSRVRPDFYVTYRLILRREKVRVHNTPAQRTLDGMSMSPSITFQSTETEIRTYENSHFAIGIAEGREGRLLWYGGMERRVRNSFEPHLGDSIASILGKFPPSESVADRHDADPQPRILTAGAFLTEPWGGVELE